MSDVSYAHCPTMGRSGYLHPKIDNNGVGLSSLIEEYHGLSEGDSEGISMVEEGEEWLGIEELEDHRVFPQGLEIIYQPKKE